MAITHKRLFRGECVPNDGDVLRKLGDLQRGFASSEHVTVHLSPRSLARFRVKVLWERPCSQHSRRHPALLFLFHVPSLSGLFFLCCSLPRPMPPTETSKARPASSSRPAGAKANGRGVRALSSSLQRLCFCQCHVLISSSRCSRPETFLAQSFFSSLFEGRKQMDQGGEECGSLHIEHSRRYLLVPYRQRFSAFCVITV